jgi:hypothetical protein
MRRRSRCVLATVASFALCRAALASDGSPATPCATTPWLCWSTSMGKIERPSTGVDALLSGSALTAIGALSFATAPLCKTSIVSGPNQDSCFAVSFVAGAPLFALGVPLIVLGAVQHSKYEDWARKYPALSTLVFSPTSGGAALAWGTKF